MYSRLIGKVLFKERCSCETPDYSPYVAQRLRIRWRGLFYPSALITINRIQEQLRLGFESGKTTTEVSSRPGPVEMPIRRCSSPLAHHIGSRRTRHLALTGFESFCPAMAQGPSRLARGQLS